MAEQKHTSYELKQMQSLPLEIKLKMTCRRVQEWYDYWEGNVYLSYSGGKDSTVLMDIIKNKCGLTDIPIVFIDTGLEYPEVREFATSRADEVLRPKMTFVEVIKKYGYPIVSKENAKKIYEVKNTKSEKMRNLRLYGCEKGNMGRLPFKWRFLLDAPFDVSSYCCDVMKKRTVKQYEKRTKFKPFVGTLAEESLLRKSSWIRQGCNAFLSSCPISTPLAFWTEQDILKYIAENNLEIAEVYGDVIKDEDGRYITSGVNRTGCVFCGFGCHLEKEPNRFQQLAETHPKLYNYCINGGEYNEDGKWQPNSKGLGLGHVLDFINVKYK